MKTAHSIKYLFIAAWKTLATGTHPAQERTGTRFRGSRHPRRKPIGHRAKRRRLRKLQTAAIERAHSVIERGGTLGHAMEHALSKHPEAGRC